jgi:phosphoribosylformimino-5-aminoimidazole carboxamide ribonucleotide (ProFAR) isomerase
MLAKRIIPCLDVEKGRVVKGTKFLDLVDAGDPVAVAARYEAEGADELVFLDITASHEGRTIMLDVVRRVAETIFMPFTVGGGIRTLADACELVQAGAEKVSINSAAVRTPALVSQVAARLGSCATVVNIDPKRVVRDGREIWAVFVSGGREPTGLELIEFALQARALRTELHTLSHGPPLSAPSQQAPRFGCRHSEAHPRTANVSPCKLTITEVPTHELRAQLASVKPLTDGANPPCRCWAPYSPRSLRARECR